MAFYHHNNLLTQVFGNFFPCPVTIQIPDSKGVLHTHTFACTEALFHCLKYPYNQQIYNEFGKCDGDGAFQYNKALRNQNVPIHSNWDKMRDDAMKQILYLKFTQNPLLGQALLATGSSYLVEHNETSGRDNYWSDNKDGTGKNMLGVLLMDLRKELGGPTATGRVNPPTGYHSNYGIQRQ